MSVLYRAVWSDVATVDVRHTVEQLKARVVSWAYEGNEPESGPEGVSELVVSQGRRRRVESRVPGADSFEVVATDQGPGESIEWVTIVRVVTDRAKVHTLVELRMSSDDVAVRVSIGRPRVVHELLVAAARPMLGTGAIVTEPLAIPRNGVEILTTLLADEGRALPVIVCSEPGGVHDDKWLSTADKIAARVEGVATVVTLDQGAVTGFRRVLGNLAVWGGGIRVYAPGAVTQGSDGWRHRYYTWARIDQATRSTVDRIVYSVAQLSARRRVPGLFRVFAEQNSVPSGASDGMVSAQEFSDAREQWEFDLEVARDEQSALEKELAAANGHLARLKQELAALGMSELLWATLQEEASSMPDEVQDTSEAVMAAQMYLSDRLALPESAVRELVDIDTAPEAYSWGNKAWRGLRALAAYADDRAGGWSGGGFWEWCASGPLLGWPATSKKLSMTESETVQNSDKLSRTRVFKVAPELKESGEMLMLSHLKIAEGGGSLAPRIYFHDDTSGCTGKMHVGFVGPHYLVPNKSAN